MPYFKLLEDQYNKRWVILAPNRAHRPADGEAMSGKPDSHAGTVPICPFCPGIEKKEKELGRIGGKPGDKNWEVLVLENKFPFTKYHEVIVHAPIHEDSFRSLPLEHVEKIIQVFRARYNFHTERKHGQVIIFHNHKEAAGESLRHPHSQLAVVSFGIHIDCPILHISTDEEHQQTDHFVLFCPETSQWPDEVWIAPKKRGARFGDITYDEIQDFSEVLQRLVHIMALRHGNEFPYNFYIYPGTDWYVRLIPRVKILGGFELGTNIFVNTQEPKETIAFIKEHFYTPDEEKIKTAHKARYKRSV